MIVALLLSTFVGNVRCDCVPFEDVCFEDMGNNDYMQDNVMKGKIARQVIVSINTGETYHLSAVGADFGYLFEQSHVVFAGEVVVSDPLNMCVIPFNKAQFRDKIVVGRVGGCFDEVKAAMASMFGAKGLVLLNTKDSGFGRIAAHPCIPRGSVRRDFALVVIQDLAQTAFLQSRIRNGSIENITIASAGPGIGETCGIRRGRAKSPYCSGYFWAHVCNSTSKTCVCREPMYTPTGIDGKQTCKLAEGVDLHLSMTNHTACVNGGLLPGSSGCNSASFFCGDFPKTVCYNGKCYCQLGFTLRGKIGDKYSTCIPKERYMDQCLNVEVHGQTTPNLTGPEKKYVDACIVKCYDIGACIAFHIERSSGTCITYTKDDVIPQLTNNEWLLYKT